MSSRSRYLRWLSTLPLSHPETYGRRFRYLCAESNARFAIGAEVATWSAEGRANYQAAAATEFARAMRGRS